MFIKKLPGKAVLKKCIQYSPTTGIFTWKTSKGRSKAGTPAGCVNAQGYRYIRIDLVTYKASRIAWMLFYGEDPGANLIDHINRNPADDRISNLRLATRAQNQQNLSVRKDNTSGEKGVMWCRARSQWAVMVGANGRRISGGYHKDFDEAVAVARGLRLKHHGEFSA